VKRREISYAVAALGFQLIVPRQKDSAHLHRPRRANLRQVTCSQLQVFVPAQSFSVLLRCRFGCGRSRRAVPWWPPAHAGLEQNGCPSALFEFQIVGTVELTEQQRNQLAANERRKLTP
jgi:hypothetical protein